jgi:hypothetical protein
MEKIRGNEEGGRDVFGQRHGEGKGRVAQGGWEEGKVQNLSLLLISQRDTTKEVIKFMRREKKT